ncbi:MAG: ATP-binding protein [Candidatus Cloacimonadaceae bacterium]|jgi:signal transduction histidine kinase|nr:cyclic nucleotide-binding domain-containing protein [Candidatus Cloacimonadota bacterium]
MKKESKKKIINLFDGIDESSIDRIKQQLKSIKFKKGDKIQPEKEKGSCLYVILKGKVEIKKEGKDSEQSITSITVMEEGEFFGEQSFLNAEPCIADAIALEDTELLEIPEEELQRLCFSYPNIMLNLFSALSERINLANERFADSFNEMIRKNRLTAIGKATSKLINDIKSPLTIISLNAQLIETLFPKAEDLTQGIIKQANLMDELLQETLDYIKGNPTHLIIQKVDMVNFLKDIEDTYGPSLKSRNIELVIENKCSEPAYFDERRIRRAIINLIRNSSEAIGTSGTIKITANLASNWLQISVIDDGPGVPPAVVADLFKPFISYNKPNGAGLGLSICQKHVLEHKGRLEYTPAKPQGARFDIRIPQKYDLYGKELY